MKYRIPVVLLALLPMGQLSASEGVCAPPADLGLIEAVYLVHVAPVYPADQLERGEEACVVLAFGLVPMPGARKGALIATSPSVILAPERSRQAFVNAAERALSKWLFLSSRNEPTEKHIYYASIPFEIADDEKPYP